MCPNVDSTVSTFCANVDLVDHIDSTLYQRRVSVRWPFSLYQSINYLSLPIYKLSDTHNISNLRNIFYF